MAEDNFELFKSKLYNPRGISGTPNTEGFPGKEIRWVELQVADQPLFIGVAPTGSKLKGYSNEDSDLDLALIIDSSLPLKSGEKYEGKGISELGLGKEKGVHFVIADVNLLTLELNHHFIDSEDNNFDHRAVNAMALMTGIVTGKKIENTRARIKSLISRLKEKQRQELKEKTIIRLVSMDMMSLVKIAERDSDFPVESDEFKEARKNLWVKRFHGIWDY